jgi:hypothetical protein
MTAAELEEIRRWPASVTGAQVRALVAEVDRLRALAEGWRMDARRVLADGGQRYVENEAWANTLTRCAAEVLR